MKKVEKDKEMEVKKRKRKLEKEGWVNYRGRKEMKVY
jgi:hypothetical protein